MQGCPRPRAFVQKQKHVLSKTGQCVMSSNGFEECGMNKHARLELVPIEYIL
ncbi:hypothetical protein M422DRAFT_35931, partial [Sphaerobolus stellatus SS14]